MENMNDLKDLLNYEVQCLAMAETQIIEAMPAMMEKAHNPQLRQALEQHLRITEQQRDRLNQVMEQLGEASDASVFSSMPAGEMRSQAMEGLIADGQKLLSLGLRAEVMDAAIIGCAQKIEHLEIAGYGTVRSYAEQLGLTDVAQLLQQTLMEEHDADERLTMLAVQRVNQEAEAGATANG
jgi:ferritin-like metal-binding protein YciE